MKIKTLLLLLFLTNNVLAAGKGGGSIKDLIFPAINFIILFGFIIYKYRNILSKGYYEESVRIQTLLADAAEADKQASLKLETLSKEYRNIDVLKSDLKDKANQKLSEQVELINAEAKSKIKKLEDDKQSRFLQDKASITNKLNSQILDLVIKDAKEIVGKDKNTKRNTEEKLLASIR